MQTPLLGDLREATFLCLHLPRPSLLGLWTEINNFIRRKHLEQRLYLEDA